MEVGDRVQTAWPKIRTGRIVKLNRIKALVRFTRHRDNAELRGKYCRVMLHNLSFAPTRREAYARAEVIQKKWSHRERMTRLREFQDAYTAPVAKFHGEHAVKRRGKTPTSE